MSALILNERPSAGTVTASADIAARLRQGMNDLKGAFYDLETGHVNYRAIPGSEAYGAFRALTQELNDFDPGILLSQEARLAFWINLYNALVVDGIIACGIVSTVKEQRGFFEKVAYRIGGETYSLDVIEHGILRRNAAKHPLLPRPLRRNDPRQEHMLQRAEPRIHFTLVCGSKSCPPIGVYQEERIEAQLELAAQAFVNSDQVQPHPDNQRLSLSHIFKWYGRDFGSRPQLLQWLSRYRRNPSESAWLQANASQIQINWLPYDWGLNLT